MDVVGKIYTVCESGLIDDRILWDEYEGRIIRLLFAKEIILCIGTEGRNFLKVLDSDGRTGWMRSYALKKI